MLDPLDPLVCKLTNYMISCGFWCVGNLAGSFYCCCSHRPTGHHQACHEQTVGHYYVHKHVTQDEGLSQSIRTCEAECTA